MEADRAQGAATSGGGLEVARRDLHGRAVRRLACVGVCLCALAGMPSVAASADGVADEAAVSAAVPGGPAEAVPKIAWTLAEDRTERGQPVSLFVEREKTPGRPAFRVETIFAASPAAATAELREAMLSETDVPRGQRRRILEERGDVAFVHTYLDLPLMMADRELALRLVTTRDAETGVHRVEWHEANEVLPPPASGVVRLEGTRGFWEFRPDGPGRSRVVYQSQAETGGSIPTAFGDRMMKGQAIEAVTRLRNRLHARQRTHVAAEGPPRGAPAAK